MFICNILVNLLILVLVVFAISHLMDFERLEQEWMREYLNETQGAVPQQGVVNNQ